MITATTAPQSLLLITSEITQNTWVYENLQMKETLQDYKTVIELQGKRFSDTGFHNAKKRFIPVDSPSE